MPTLGRLQPGRQLEAFGIVARDAVLDPLPKDDRRTAACRGTTDATQAGLCTSPGSGYNTQDLHAMVGSGPRGRRGVRGSCGRDDGADSVVLMDPELQARSEAAVLRPLALLTTSGDLVHRSA